MTTEVYVKQDPDPHPLVFTMPEGAIDAHMHVIGRGVRFAFLRTSRARTCRPTATPSSSWKTCPTA